MNLRANEPDFLGIENQLKQWIEELGHCDLSDALILSRLAARQARKDADAEWSAIVD